MSYDPTNESNENEALDPAGAPQAPGASAAVPEPPPPPPAAPLGDPLFDNPAFDNQGDGAAAAGTAASPRATSMGNGVDKRTLIGAGVGAAVIALGAVVGINLASSGAENTTNAAATGPAGLTGQPPGATQDGGAAGQGQMPGGPQGGGPAGTTGTVDGIGDGTLTLATEDGESVEVTTTDDTEVSIAETGSADDIDEGDTVMVIGQSGDDSSVTADRVIERSDDEGEDGDDAQRGPGGPGGVAGEVSSVDGERFVVATDSGDVTVTMTDDTTVVIERSGSVDDLSEGDEIFVHTHEDDDGSAWAERIVTGDALPDGGMMGQPPSGVQGGATDQSGTLAPPDQGDTDGAGPSGATGGAPGANAGPSGVTTS